MQSTSPLVITTALPLALNERVTLINERGDSEKMSLKAFISNGKTITFSLSEQVRDFQICQKDIRIPENEIEARELIRRFDQIQALIEKVKNIAADFRSEKEKVKPIEDFITRVHELFLSSDLNPSTNLIDRINALKEGIKLSD